MRLPILLAALLLALPARADTPPDCTGAPCAGGPVQEESPFLWFGMPLSDPKVHDPVKTKYGQIAEKYPSVASCLEDSTVPPDILDARIDWEAVETREEAEVCLLRLFARIGSLDGIILWLDRNGFGRLFLYVETGPLIGPYISVSGRYDTKTHGRLYGSASFHPLNNLLVKSITLSVRWNGRVTGARIAEQSIWSK